MIGYVHFFESQCLFVRVRRSRSRIPLCRSRSVAAANQLTVQIRDKAVVVHQPQGKRLQSTWVVDIERYANIRRGIDTVHLRLHVSVDEGTVTGAASTACYRRRIYCESTICGIAHQPKISGTPS